MTVRRFAPKFLESFTFQASANNHALLCALDLLKRLNREPHRPMSGKPPLSFLPKAWRRLVAKDGGVDRRLYEIAALAVTDEPAGGSPQPTTPIAWMAQVN